MDPILAEILRLRGEGKWTWQEIGERVGLSWQAARGRARRHDRKQAVELEPEEPRISVTKEGDAEVFQIDGELYRIPLADKRRIYALYSRDGANAQIADIELEFGIPRAAFDAIKRYWGLTHSSMMWPDEDVAERDHDELIEEGLANQKRLLHRKFQSERRRHLEREYESLLRRASLEDRLIEAAKDVLTAWEPPNVFIPYRTSDSFRRLYVALSDWHVGKRTLPLVASPGFSKEIMLERVERLKDGLNRAIREVSFGIEEIIVVSHGDMLDNPDGTTYPRQDRGQDLHDWHQLLETAKLMGDFFYFVASRAKRATVKVIPGNHGMTYDTAAGYMAAQRLSACENVCVTISETPYTSVDRGKNLFIALHGDKVRRSGNARENSIMKTIMMKGQPGKRHYVTYGHLHHRSSLSELTREGTGYEWYLCPSMVGGDEYSEGFQATSRPAQLALMVDDDEGVLYPRTLYVD